MAKADLDFRVESGEPTTIRVEIDGQKYVVRVTVGVLRVVYDDEQQRGPGGLPPLELKAGLVVDTAEE